MATRAQIQRRLVEQHRRAQLANRAGFLREFLAAWGLLDVNDLERSYPNWLRVVMRLIRAFRQDSARLSLDHYRDMRRVGVPDAEIGMPEVDFDLGRLLERSARRRRTHPDASVPARVIREARELRRSDRPPRLTIHWDRADRAAESSLQITGPINIKQRIARGETPEKAARNALVEASGAAGRHVNNGGRSSLLTLVQNDKVAMGWIRITDANPCAFCAMLASRGPVYKGQAFSQSDPRFSGPGQVKVHDHCQCSVMPVFSREDVWPGRGKEFQSLWNDHIQGRFSGKDAINAWRRLIERPDVFKQKQYGTRPARRDAA